MNANGSGSLKGQVAVVTGAGRGIGAAIAVRLARLDANVVLCGRTLKPLQATFCRAPAFFPPASGADSSSMNTTLAFKCRWNVSAIGSRNGARR